MRKNRKKLLALSLGTLMLMSGCETNIFGPNEGSFTGTIKDVHGTAISGANITATYTRLDSEDDQTGSVSAISDEDGLYELLNVPLAESEVSVEADGYESKAFISVLTQDNIDGKLNFTLVGTPELLSINLSNMIIYQDSISGSDTSTVLSVDIQDVYNSSSSTTFNVNALLRNSDGDVSNIVSISATNNSSTFFQFEETIFANDLDAGSYSLDLEFVDSDGNLRLEEDLLNLEVQ